MILLIVWIAAFVIAITVHEAAHAWMANYLGDPTPKMMGRLSLNPVVHYDRVGTTLLLVLVFMRAFGAPVIPFGWAKPVVFDPYNLKNPRRDSALISLAGPGSNLLLALILSIIARLTSGPFSPLNSISTIVYPIVFLNVALAIFNLIPIHPLDGGKILVGILPQKDAYEVDKFLNRFGLIILFFLIFPIFGGVSPINNLIVPAINFVLKLMLPGSSLL
jgi:Zn-dependent protease